MRRHLIRWLFVPLALLSACASLPEPAERVQHAEGLVASHGWTREVIQTPPFDLRAYVPARFTSSPQLTIYIEGDGLAWTTPSPMSST